MNTTKEIIGTDISLEICKNEGYFMLETDGEFNLDKEYRIFAYYPLYSNIEGIAVEGYYSWNELYKKYVENKEQLDRFADDLSEISKHADYYSLLHIADSVHMFLGLD